MPDVLFFEILTALRLEFCTFAYNEFEFLKIFSSVVLQKLQYLPYSENTKVPPQSTVNVLNVVVAQSIFCNFSGNNITAV